MPPGYRLELVASEPMIQDPILITWDPDGRLWAIEMPGYMPEINPSNEHERMPTGRVVVLEDTNNDGRMDKRTIFADGLILARSLGVLDRGVLVGEPPNVWLMHDTNGDLRMDTKELVATGYGRLNGDPQNNANGFYWALDNRIYSAGSGIDFSLRLKDGRFETQTTLQRGEWGVTQDDAGRIYRNTNESALHVDLVPTAYYARNPNLLRTRGSYERLADTNPDLNIVWPVRPNPGTNRAYQFGIDRLDGTLAQFTAACAPLVYRGDRLPAELYGNAFVADPAANLVSRLVLADDGASLRARKAYEKGEFLASTDERFRPVYLSNAPDGTLYIVDMYRGIIEHRNSITLYLRDQILSRKLETPTGLGRIYRVVHDTTRRDRQPALSKASPMQLVDALSHPNGWWRDTAQRLLVERGGISGVGRAPTAVMPALTKLAEGAPEGRARLHALWTLDGIDRIAPATVVKALEDPSRDVRLSAIRISERWLGEAKHPIQAALLKRLDDGDWAVRQQLAASIGSLSDDVRVPAVVSLLERYAGDPVVMDAALSGLRGREAMVLQQMLQSGVEQPPTQGFGEPGRGLGEGRTSQRDIAITMLSATVVRGAQDSAIHNLFAQVAGDTLSSWQRSALLRGVEVALGVPGVGMPEPVGRGAPATTSGPGAPCPTCPGGRAGPGGAYAFPEPTRATGAGTGRGAIARTLRLNREPAPLLGIAAGGSNLASRAASVLARVEWPGKPGVAAPVPPLTPEEQQRFDAGRDVYKNVCQACHQPDGRGQEKLAPSLVGSVLTLARADIPVRILLQGKEGAIGLMPPIGNVFTNDQIAAVLTYIRREWSQTGAPVDPATVATVRRVTASRTRPWTNDELIALAGTGRGGSR